VSKSVLSSKEQVSEGNEVHLMNQPMKKMKYYLMGTLMNQPMKKMKYYLMGTMKYYWMEKPSSQLSNIDDPTIWL
jgi:hypothetical protein